MKKQKAIDKYMKDNGIKVLLHENNHSLPVGSLQFKVANGETKCVILSKTSEGYVYIKHLIEFDNVKGLEELVNSLKKN